MADGTSMFEVNDRLAQQIQGDVRKNPNSPYAHKYVGIANGKVVVIAETLREVDLALDAAEPNPENCRIVDTIGDYETIQEIWSQD